MTNNRTCDDDSNMSCSKMMSCQAKLLCVMLGGVCGALFLFWMNAIDIIARNRYADCPPFDQCTPSGDWNHPNCKCWETEK